MNKLVEKAFYTLFSNKAIYNVEFELKQLKKELPESFKKRDVTDIGCGNGKTSLKLKKILKPKTFKGVDNNKTLIFYAKRRGLNVKNLNIEKKELSGDLGVLWSVLHHFKNPTKTLKKLYNNFNSLIIRESTNNNRLFEVGHKLDEKELIKILTNAGIKTSQCKPIKVKQTRIILIEK